MQEIITNVNKNTTGIFSRIPVLIVILPNKIVSYLGDDKVYLSEFVVAKIKGKIGGYEGHPLVTDEVLRRVPASLSDPLKIFEDIRKKDKKEYLFINGDPLHQIIVEVERKQSGLTEINTIFDTTLSELKRLEGKLPTVNSSGETPGSRIRASP